MKRLFGKIYLAMLFAFFGIGICKAQITTQLNGGVAMTKFQNPYLGGKFGTGYEFGYQYVAKYSERLEWQSGASYIRTQNNSVPAYYLTQGQSGPAKATKTEASFTVNAMSFDYVISYYIIPDILAVGVGLNLQLFFPGSWDFDNTKGSTLYLCKDDISGKELPQNFKQINNGTMSGVSFINLGAQGIIYVMPFEWLQIYGKYTQNFNDPLSSDSGSALPADYGKVNFGVFRFGIGLRNIRSARDKRF